MHYQEILVDTQTQVLVHMQIIKLQRVVVILLLDTERCLQTLLVIIM